MTMRKFLQKETGKVCDDWIKFKDVEFQKENWDGIKETLFTFKSRGELANFSERGWNKIGQL